MDERALRRFTAGLPIPKMNPLQERLAAEIVRLEDLSADRAMREAEADREIWQACRCLAEAMGAAGIDRNSDGEPIRPYDYDDPEAEKAYEEARAPWEAVEDWILRKGSGTGSARVLAVCYLGRILALKMDWKEVYGGTLDTDRSSLATDMIRSPRPARLPYAFWRIFISYREATAKEWEHQGAHLAH